MKHLRFLFLFVILYNSNGLAQVIPYSLSWSRLLSPSQNVAAICPDDSGNVFVAGTPAPAGVYFSKQRASAPVWTLILPGIEAVSIKRDNAGFIYLLGITYRSLVNSVDSADYLLKKYTPGGSLVWSVGYNDSLNFGDKPSDMFIAPNNDIYVTGSIFIQSSSFSIPDIFTIRYSNTGNVIWTSRYDAPGLTGEQSLCITSDNNNVIVGGKVTDFASSAEDGLLIKMNSTNGLFQWAHTFNYSTFEHISKVVITPAGNFVGANEDGNYLEIFCYSPSGTLLWFNNYSVYRCWQVKAIKSDPLNNVSFAFEFDSLMSPGCGLIKFSPTGQLLLRKSSWTVYPHDAKFDNYGNVIYAGSSLTGAGLSVMDSTGTEIYSSSFTLGNPTTYFKVAVDNFGTIYPGGAYNTTFLIQKYCRKSTQILITSSTICIGQQIQLIASGATQYSWSPTNSLNNSFLYNPIATPSVTTTYTVQGTAMNGCISNASVTISVNTPPAVTAYASNSSICHGASDTLFAFGAPNFVWSSGGNTAIEIVTPVASSTYFVVGIAANGCTDTAVVVVSVNPNIVTNALNGQICIGESDTLVVSGASTYLWNFGGTNSSEIVSPLNTTTYSVIGTDASGCTDTSTVTVTVNNLPAVSATALVGLICQGQSDTLFGSGATAYSWSSGGINSVEPVSPFVTTTYTLTGTASNGCSDTATIAIIVQALPIVTLDLSPIDTQCVSMNTVLLNGASPFGGVYSGIAVTGNQFSPTIAGVGTFVIAYTYSDTFGCTNIAVDSIYVDVCMGLKSNDNNFLNVFPNPASYQINIEMCLGNSSQVTIEVIDILGQIVKVQNEILKASNQLIQLNTTDLVNGNYILRIRANNEIVNKKIEINH